MDEKTKEPIRHGRIGTAFYWGFPTLVALIVAFGWLGRAGIVVYDEAFFLLAGNTITEGVYGVLSGKEIGVLSEEISRSGGTLYFAAKPGYVFLSAGLGLLTGGVTMWKAKAISALAFVASTLLIQLIAWRRLPPLAAFLAPLFFAATPLAVQYGRVGLGIMPAVGLGLLSLWLVTENELRWERCRSFAAGAVAAFALTCHYNILPFFLALCFILLILKAWRKIILFAIGGLILAGAMETGMLLADYTLRSAHPEFRSMGGEIYDAFRKYHIASDSDTEKQTSTDGMRGYSPATYSWLFTMLLGRMGLVLIAGLAGSTFLMLSSQETRQNKLFLLSLAFIPLLFWVIYPWKVLRCYPQTIPGLAILAGIGAASLTQKFTKGRCWWAVSGIAASLLTIHAIKSAVSESRPSPYERAFTAHHEWLDDLPPKSFTQASHHAKASPHWIWYLGHQRHHVDRSASSITDFSSFDPPLIIIVGPQSDLPDPGFAGQNPGGYTVPIGPSNLGDDVVFRFYTTPESAEIIDNYKNN